MEQERKNNKKEGYALYSGIVLICFVIGMILIIGITIVAAMHTRSKYNKAYNTALHYWNDHNWKKCSKALEEITMNGFKDADDMYTKAKNYESLERYANSAYKNYESGNLVKAYEYAVLSEDYLRDILKDKQLIENIRTELYYYVDIGKKGDEEDVR